MQPFKSRLVQMTRFFDALFVSGSLFVAGLAFNVKWDNSYNLAAIWAVVLFFLVAQSRDLYRPWRGTSLRHDFVRIWVIWLTVFLGLLFLAYVTKTSAIYSRKTIVAWFLVAPWVLISWRLVLQLIFGMVREKGINTRTVAIVGARDLGAKLAKTIMDAPWMGLNPVGFYDDRKITGARPLASEPLTVVGNLERLVSHAKEGRLDLICITLPMRAEKRIQRLVAELSDTTASVCIVPDFFMSNLMHSSWSNIGDIPTVSIFETPFYGVDGLVKRIEDFVLASLILLLIAIPMLIIALGVKSTSPGPVLFKQKRYGLRGNSIEVWKFRTMTVDVGEINHNQATKYDSRITPMGSILRRTSLDELPQFFNVLQGSMSIVGPRPHAVIHNEQYRKLISGYMLRHKVKPGITGLAQIRGWRGETETLDKMEKRIQYDLAYIRNWSLWLDVKIIFLTIFRGFTGKNAY